MRNNVHTYLLMVYTRMIIGKSVLVFNDMINYACALDYFQWSVPLFLISQMMYEYRVCIN